MWGEDQSRTLPRYSRILQSAPQARSRYTRTKPRPSFLMRLRLSTVHISRDTPFSPFSYGFTRLQMGSGSMVLLDGKRSVAETRRCARTCDRTQPSFIRPSRTRQSCPVCLEEIEIFNVLDPNGNIYYQRSPSERTLSAQLRRNLHSRSNPVETG